jgi:hypothetical protein
MPVRSVHEIQIDGQIVAAKLGGACAVGPNATRSAGGVEYISRTRVGEELIERGRVGGIGRVVVIADDGWVAFGPQKPDERARQEVWRASNVDGALVIQIRPPKSIPHSPECGTKLIHSA